MLILSYETCQERELRPLMLSMPRSRMNGVGFRCHCDLGSREATMKNSEGALSVTKNHKAVIPILEVSEQSRIFDVRTSLFAELSPFQI